jgi:hypothetical protein
VLVGYSYLFGGGGQTVKILYVQRRVSSLSLLCTPKSATGAYLYQIFAVQILRNMEGATFSTNFVRVLEDVEDRTFANFKFWVSKR